MPAGDRAMCVGAVTVDGIGKQHVVRNLGGTAKCCKMFPKRARRTRRTTQFSRNAATCSAADQTERRASTLPIPAWRATTLPRATRSGSCSAAHSPSPSIYRTPAAVPRASLGPMIPVGKWAGACGGDRYCDANYVCDVGCSEIDILEANQHALHATTHTNGDGAGRASGLGGSRFDLSSDDYGPAAKIIDTRGEFARRLLPAGERQAWADRGRPPAGGARRPIQIGSSSYNAKLTDDLKAGVTPVMSYWSDASMSWLGGGVCPADSVHLQDACGARRRPLDGSAARRVAFDSHRRPGRSRRRRRRRRRRCRRHCRRRRRRPPPPSPRPPSTGRSCPFAAAAAAAPAAAALLSPSQSAPHHRHSGRAHGAQHPLRTPPPPPPATDDPFSTRRCTTSPAPWSSARCSSSPSRAAFPRRAHRRASPTPTPPRRCGRRRGRGERRPQRASARPPRPRSEDSGRSLTAGGGRGRDDRDGGGTNQGANSASAAALNPPAEGGDCRCGRLGRRLHRAP